MVQAMIPYDEWVPLVMGQDATPRNVQTKKEVRRVRLGLDFEDVLEGGDDGGEAENEEADVDVDEEVGGHEGEGTGAHPSGGATGFSSTPGLSQEVQQALAHSKNVVLGKTPSILTKPPPHLPAAPGAPGTLRVPTPLEKQQIRQAVLKVHKEVSGRRRPTGPWQAAPQPPTPRSQSTTPAGTRGAAQALVPPAATPANLPPQKRLLDEPVERRGKRWHDRMNKAHTSWGATQTQLWEAHRLLTGKDQWATPKATYLPSTQAMGATSMRYLCGEASCQHRSASVLDARGHHQATHLNLTSSPLCSCRNNTFYNTATLANHLDMQHNIHPDAVMRSPPSALLMFLDRRCVTDASQGATVATPPNSQKGQEVRRSKLPTYLLTLYILFIIFVHI